MNDEKREGCLHSPPVHRPKWVVSLLTVLVSSKKYTTRGGHDCWRGQRLFFSGGQCSEALQTPHVTGGDYEQ